MKPSDAAKRGRLDLVAEAVKSGSEVDLQLLLEKVCHDYHSTKKHQGHLEVAVYLLSVGAKPTRQMAFEAARGGHEALTRVLVEGGLAPDLFVAAALGDADGVSKLLQENAACVTETDSHGMTPLHYVCASSIWRLGGAGSRRFQHTCSALLTAGAEVDVAATYHGLTGVTPLFSAAWTGGHAGIARHLLDRGAPVTPDIFFAAVGHFQRHGDGNYEVAELLLEYGFDINHREERTALHAFASHEDARGVAWLLEHGANVDAVDSTGNTPLMVAARRNSGVRVLHLLVEAGCSITAKNHAGQTALELAKNNGRRRGFEFLSSLGG